MKTVILLLSLVLSASAATLYPVLTDNSGRTFTGGATNLALLSGTNVFSGTNTFNTNTILGAAKLQDTLDAKAGAANLITVSNAQVTTDGKLAGYITNLGGFATNAALTGGTATGQTNLDLTASRVMVSDANKVPASSSVTTTELAHLSGVTGGVQTNIAARLPLAGGTMSGAISWGSSSAILNSDNSFPWILRTVGGANIAYIESSGKLTLNGGIALNGTITGASSMTLPVSGAFNSDFYSDRTGTTKAYFQTSSTGIGWNLVNRVTTDVNLVLKAVSSQTADFLQFQNSSGSITGSVGVDGTTRIYGAYTDASNYVRASLSSGTTSITLQAETAGTGADNIPINLVPAGTSGVVIGSGGAGITKILSATASLDFNLTAVVVEDLTITCTGAATGDVVTLGVPAGSVTSTVQFTAWVSSADTVTVRARTSAAGENPASGTFRATVIKH